MEEPTLRVDADGCDADNLCYSGAVSVKADPAFPWAALVDRAVEDGWTGVEALASFDGTVAEAVATNHSAFGQHVADVVWCVRDLDDNGQPRTHAAADCGFEPGLSRFWDAGRILGVELVFRAGTITAPLGPDLATLTGAAEGDRVPLHVVRDALRMPQAPVD